MTNHGESPSLHLVPLSSGGELPMVQTANGPRVILARAIGEHLGIDAESQIRQLRRQAWADVEYANVVAADGRVRRAVVCSASVFLMYLATVETGRVGELARDDLARFQRETRDAIEGYWLRGLAVNPRGRTPEQVEQIERVVADLPAIADDLQQSRHWWMVAEGRIVNPPNVPRAEAYRRSALRGARAAERFSVNGLEVIALPPAE